MPNYQFNEQSEMAEIARELRRRVNGLLRTYFALIVGTLIFFLAVLVGACWAAYSLYMGVGLSINMLIILAGVVIVAGVCVAVVLKPLIGIFRAPANKGEEIRREDYPELFAMIDEVVAQAGCLQPRHVYISNELNAYVRNPNFWGYISPGPQNLTIGLPLLTVLNRTEMKAILAHEFGHFTQKSLNMNRIANLSEFICASLNQSADETREAEAGSYKADASLFAMLATRIMSKQYLKVAPLNGILSRAQEFDADACSCRVAGSAAAISALSKISFFSTQWVTAMSYIRHIMHDEERKPLNVKMVVDVIVDDANAGGKLDLRPSVHLTRPMEELVHRFSWVNNDTHPSTADRCSAIGCLPLRETLWDDAPALSYFPEGKVRQVFDSLMSEFATAMSANRTVFFKQDVDEAKVKHDLKTAFPGFLNSFFLDPIFYCDQTSVGLADLQNGPEEFPFTEANAAVLREYYVADEDLNALEQVAQENSRKRFFYYENTRYTGDNVPMQKHLEYYEPLRAKALDLALRCNRWMVLKGREDRDGGEVFRLLRDAVVPHLQLGFLKESADIIDSVISEPNSPITVKKDFKNQFDARLREAAGCLMEKDANGLTKLEMIASRVGVKEEAIADILKYFASPRRESDEKMVKAYYYLHNMLGNFLSNSLDSLTEKWIMPEIRK